MTPWLLLGLLLNCAHNSHSAALEVVHTIASNAAALKPAPEVQSVDLPWIACNDPPRYKIDLIRSHCQKVHDGITRSTHSYRRQGWHGINTPQTLTEESDDCVVRLETNNRDQSDVFSRSLMAHVALQISQTCILGGAASIGTKGFCELIVLSIGSSGCAFVERGDMSRVACVLRLCSTISCQLHGKKG